MAFENDPFSLDVRAGVVDTAKKHGMKIVIDDKLPADLSDISATLTKYKALKPDILLVSGHSKGAATAARQFEEMKINLNIKSKSGIHKLLSSLEEKGYIKRLPHRARALKLNNVITIKEKKNDTLI